jgi:16S rRNA (uracil1498-N3)-methyltransferase
MIRAPIAGLRTALTPDLTHYLVRVRRLEAGDGFVAFDPVTRREADATLVDERTIALTNERDGVVATRDVVLLYCLAKGDKVDDVVRDATELGATRIVLARAERSVVKVDAERGEAKRARWVRIAEQAARQCGRADPPAIEGVLDLGIAFERARADASFLLDPHAADELGPLLSLTVPGSLAFAIGPEGGFAPAEVALAAEKSWVPAAFGSFVLRTETVAAAILGAVRVLTPQIRPVFPESGT